MWHTRCVRSCVRSICVRSRLCFGLYGAPVLMWYNKYVTGKLLLRLDGALAYVAHQICQG